jgi:hypothetical protein
MFGRKNQIKSVPINSTSPDSTGDVCFSKTSINGKLKVQVLKDFFNSISLLLFWQAGINFIA